MSFRFTVRDWQAYAPGLPDKAAWEAWARAPLAPRGDAAPALAEMPAMQRRRVEQLGRMALQVAYWCQQADDAALPLVFASRHGDLSRTYAMLRDLAQGRRLVADRVRPVHAQFDRGPIRHRAPAYRPMPGGFRRDDDRRSRRASKRSACWPRAPRKCWSWFTTAPARTPIAPSPMNRPRISPGRSAWRGQPGRACRLAAAADVDAAGDEADDGLPQALRVLRFLIGTTPSLSVGDGPRRWTWRRHG